MSLLCFSNKLQDFPSYIPSLFFLLFQQKSPIWYSNLLLQIINYNKVFNVWSLKETLMYSLSCFPEKSYHHLLPIAALFYEFYGSFFPCLIFLRGHVRGSCLIIHIFIENQVFMLDRSRCLQSCKWRKEITFSLWWANCIA